MGGIVVTTPAVGIGRETSGHLRLAISVRRSAKCRIGRNELLEDVERSLDFGGYR